MHTYTVLHCLFIDKPLWICAQHRVSGHVFIIPLATGCLQDLESHLSQESVFSSWILFICSLTQSQQQVSCFHEMFRKPSVTNYLNARKCDSDITSASALLGVWCQLANVTCWHGKHKLPGSAAVRKCWRSGRIMWLYLLLITWHVLSQTVPLWSALVVFLHTFS